jgi:LPS export ABC transporter protein LptC
MGEVNTLTARAHTLRLRVAIRRVSRLATAAAVMAGLALAQGCRRPPAPPARTPQGTSKRESAARKPFAGAHGRVEVGEIVVADPAGKRVWRASAQSIDWDYDKQQAVLRDVQCQFIEDGKLALEARAPLVTAYTGERRVALEGGVTARAPATQTSLRADRLQWNVEDKEVYATGNVKYVRGNIALTGPRLRADLALKRARLEGGVHMRAVQPLDVK